MQLGAERLITVTLLTQVDDTNRLLYVLDKGSARVRRLELTTGSVSTPSTSFTSVTGLLFDSSRSALYVLG